MGWQMDNIQCEILNKRDGYQSVATVWQVDKIYFFGGNQNLPYITKSPHMIQDYEQHSNLPRRDLGQEEDLELVMDKDLDDQERDLKTKILFAMQGLGGIRSVNEHGLMAYIKGPHCEESIKDLVKLIRRDSSVNPKVKLILADYNIFESDLIDLLILQLEDKKLSFWLLAFMVQLTCAPSDQLLQSEKKKMFSALRNYKKALLRRESLNSLTIHIADYFRTEPENRLKAHTQMMEFIVTFLRNVLQIPSDPDDSPHLHEHFLVLMVKEDMFEPLLYLIQTERGQLLERIDIALLEIFYHTFTCFDPDLLYGIKKVKQYVNESMKINPKREMSVRHSRFMPNFLIKSSTGVTRVSHKLAKDQEQPNYGQKRIPNKIAELKKVEKIGHTFLDENFMELEVEMHHETKQPNKTVGQIIFQLAKEFVEVEFSMLSELVFNSIYKETHPNVSDQSVIQYMLLSSWAMQMTRKKYHLSIANAKSSQEKGMIEFDLTYIACVMQTAHFQLIHKILFREATRQKKKDFKINTFHGALSLFLSYLEVIEDVSRSLSMSDRKNANMLMANVFRHDIARIFRIGFMNVNHEQILGVLITVIHRFFKLLSVYSKGKVLTIQTNKLLKKKQKNHEEEDQEAQMAGFIEEVSNQGSGDDSFNENMGNIPEHEKKPRKSHKVREIEEPMFQQRKFNQVSEFAIIAEYSIISKYLIFLKKKRFLNNLDSFNESLFFYFEKIVTLLKGEWLLYQAETLTVLQQILSEELFSRRNPNWTKLVRGISRQFIKLLKKNPLALVESLFQYSSLSIKENVLKNYENYSDQAGEQERNMFID